jgi:hypothetical protein
VRIMNMSQNTSTQNTSTQNTSTQNTSTQNTSNGIQVAASLTGATISVVGASVAVLNAATIIAVTGGAAAVVFAGCGLYCWLSKDRPRAQPSGEKPQEQLPDVEKHLLK